MTYLTDGLGSSVALANASSVIQTSYGYDATGNTTKSGTANTNSFEYTGRQADATGYYYYYRARYYNPGSGDTPQNADSRGRRSPAMITVTLHISP